MIIIVEGIDRVGKSTLCKELSKVTGYNIFRDDFRYTEEYKNKTINEEKGNTLVNLIEQGIVKDAILDRFHWSQYVYGIFERGESSREFAYETDFRLTNCKTKVIMILVNPTDVKESSRQHGKDLARHAKLFDSLFMSSTIESYSVTYDGIPELVENIKEKIENEECADTINV